jgi:cell division protein FtsB
MRTKPTDASKPFWHKLVRWPVFLMANLAFFLLVGVSTVRETYRSYTIEREIKALEAQAQALEGRKLQLVEMTQAIASPENAELEARSRLGWMKDGEKVFVLSGYQPATSSESGASPVDVPAPPLSNPERWMQYFFGPKKP